MPSDSAIIPVVTLASPRSLKSRRASARIRALVRWVRMALPSIRSAIWAANLSRRAGEPAVQVGERALQVGCGARERIARPPAAEVDGEAPVRVGEDVLA